MNLPLLTLVVFTPLLGALILLFMPKEQTRAIRAIAAVFTAIPLLIVAWMLPQYGSAATDSFGMKFVEHYNWIEALNISYYLGVDGFSFSMLALSVLVFFLACVASFGITNRVKDYFVLYLLLATGTLGVFVALDFVLFYVFWEVVLLPMYFLIGIWGGARREYAAIKFFIYTLVASVIMLVAALALYFTTGVGTFNMMEIARASVGLEATTWTKLIFLGLFVGFAVKVPMWPFHTWLPDAHVEAPTPISMILAGLLLKMGTYAMVRISHAWLPEAAKWFTTALLVLALINIVWGALAAMAQTDFKRMVAYSSINHMGFFLLGLAAGTEAGLQGAFYVAISHGLISALFFFVVGMFYDRTHTRDMQAMGGMWLTVPVISTVAAFVAFANLGLPGLSGFIGEFIALLGSFQTFGYWVLVAGFGLAITAAFHLLMMRRVLMGDKRAEWEGLPDITGREAFVFAPLGALIILFGVYPGPILKLLNPAVMNLVELLAR